MPVQQSWQRIVGWLAAHAPETAAGIRPPAGEDALRSAEATFPYSWPEDLREWYGLHDGASSQQLFTGVLPGYAELLSLDGTVAASREYQDVFSDMDDDDADALGDAADAEEAEAGAMAYRFLRSWVPIAQDGTACTMFVDCRPGAGYGCVTRFEREDADTGGPVWLLS